MFDLLPTSRSIRSYAGRLNVIPHSKASQPKEARLTFAVQAGQTADQCAERGDL
jgi:hypothetical protein